jgi:hypothetical protein
MYGLLNVREPGARKNSGVGGLRLEENQALIILVLNL